MYYTVGSRYEKYTFKIHRSVNRFLCERYAHFIAGEKKKGLCWFMGLMILSGIAVIFLCSSGILAFSIFAFSLLACLVLWLVMLKQSFRPIPKLKIWHWILLILIWMGMNLANNLFKAHACEAFRFPGVSMQPTLCPNDLIIVNKLTYKFTSPEKGDLIAFRQDGTVYVKRVSNLPDEEGVMIAGKTVLLKSDEYFVLGDNSANSKDSRYFGPVKRNKIVGKVVRIYWPINRINKL